MLVTVLGSGAAETEVSVGFSGSNGVGDSSAPSGSRKEELAAGDPWLPAPFPAPRAPRQGPLLLVMRRCPGSHAVPCLDSICIMSSSSSTTLHV